MFCHLMIPFSRCFAHFMYKLIFCVINHRFILFSDIFYHENGINKFFRTTQQNKIPVYCWTLFHTYIKQAKKINSNFIDKKKGKKNLFIFGLFNHLIQTNYL